VVYARVGTPASASTSPFYALSRSASTTTGNVTGPISLMYDLFMLAHNRQVLMHRDYN